MKRPGFQTLTINVSAVYRIELVAPGNSYKKHSGVRMFIGIFVAPGNSYEKHPGVRIVGYFELKRGQRITVALGQQGSSRYCGSGGSFLVLESDEGPKPLLIAGGAGRAGEDDEEFGRGNIKQTVVGNGNVGSSGKQEFFDGDKEDIFCAGAGFDEAPRVSILADRSEAPKSYKEGLTG